ncbi:hypothetical protein [Streptomyces sp. Ncost-T10-10d]|uniref:hypothetical protein n=1 Tax=Streptomyces sp. Ncost-T10-10d TaxID=1839774 RepID=UPI00081E074A|nr:hypothetical protein [Streptomyces sp. Ncost-T10-10d]SCF95303.1 hypothetical protein GA0115254_12679 [Streptomyces sp. Ncost-T10-10d]
MKRRAMAWMLPAFMVALSVVGSGVPPSAQDEAAAAPASATAIGPQYDTTHVYVTPGAVDAFVAGWGTTFGGTHRATILTTVTPTPSKTESELVMLPVGNLSVFDFGTPAPYPFGAEWTGWLMSDFDKGRPTGQAGGPPSPSWGPPWVIRQLRAPTISTPTPFRSCRSGPSRSCALPRSSVRPAGP